MILKSINSLNNSITFIGKSTKFIPSFVIM